MENLKCYTSEVLRSTKSLTQACDKFFEVDEAVLVLIQQAEEARCEGGRVDAAHPDAQGAKELRELAQVDAVLLQVRQAGVVAFRCRGAGTPVTAHDVLGLHGGGEEQSQSEKPIYSTNATGMNVQELVLVPMVHRHINNLLIFTVQQTQTVQDLTCSAHSDSMTNDRPQVIRSLSKQFI